MNDSADKVQAPGAALDIDAQAADFLVKRADRTNWSADDEIELESWLSQSLAHRSAYWRLESVWERADRLHALQPLKLRSARKAVMPRRRLLQFGIAAAIVAVAALGSSTSYLLLQGGPKTYSTPIGGRELIKLSDGSRIELNTDTVLRTEFAGGQRRVELVKGEALFQIRHDAAHPFVVSASGRRITDLGTEFLVRKSAGRLKIALLEGSARLTSADMRGGARILTPGDVAVATAHALSIAHKPLDDLKVELSWQHGVLVFHHATLMDVATEYNRYNRQKIVIADGVAGARVINATLPATDVGAFARMAQNFLGLNVEYRDDEVVISR